MPAPGHRRSKHGEAAQRVRARAADSDSAVRIDDDPPAVQGPIVQILLEWATTPCDACETTGKCPGCGGSGKRTNGKCSDCRGRKTCSDCGGAGELVDEQVLQTARAAVDFGMPLREQMAVMTVILREVLQDLRDPDVKRSTVLRTIGSLVDTSRKLAELDHGGKTPSAVRFTFRQRGPVAWDAIHAALDEADDLEHARELLAALESSTPTAEPYEQFGDRLEVG